jgi:hypothetical protein
MENKKVMYALLGVAAGLVVIYMIKKKKVIDIPAISSVDITPIIPELPKIELPTIKA